MLFEPGPLSFLSVDEILAPRVAPNLTGALAPVVEAARGGEAALEAQLARMSEDLGASPVEGFNDPVARAAAAHASQVHGDSPSLAAVAAAAEALDDALAHLAGDLPPAGTRAALPPVERQGDEFEGVERGPGGDEPPRPDQPDYPLPAQPGEPRPTPTPTPTPAPGDLYGSTDAGRALQAYAARNPSEAPQIERFLVSNPGDVGRAPDALSLPGWSEFLERWRRGEI